MVTTLALRSSTMARELVVPWSSATMYCLFWSVMVLFLIVIRGDQDALEAEVTSVRALSSALAGTSQAPEARPGRWRQISAL